MVWVGLADANTLLPATNTSAPASISVWALFKPTPPSISIRAFDFVLSIRMEFTDYEFYDN